MKQRFLSEWERITGTARTLDRQTAFVLVAAALLIIVQYTLGSRRLFRRSIAPLFFPDTWHGVLSWGWWFAVQGVTGFVIPVLCLLLLFKRRPAEIGLGRGDWRLALLLAGIYVPLVTAGTWILSADPAFQAQYPHYQPAAQQWTFFLVYEGLFLFYWIGWEYLWRGFLIFGTARTFGPYAILIQAIPFAALHIDKPAAEAYLSVVGGLALGALVWRCRSFWIAVPIHAAQMLILDLWCTLRLRTGVNGLGPAALFEVLTRGLGG